MRREFNFYDEDVIKQELDALPAKDAAKLIVVMDYYETVGLGDPAPAKVDDYCEGIKRIRHVKAAYQGRALFYVGESTPGYESQDVPKHILERALERKSVHAARLAAKKETER